MKQNTEHSQALFVCLFPIAPVVPKVYWHGWAHLILHIKTVGTVFLINESEEV